MSLPVPYPADTRAKGWRFALDVERIELSAGWAIAEDGSVKGSILLLLCEAWRQVPCGTLPSDDETLCALLGAPGAWFAKHRNALLRDWWLAADGRLYSTILTPQVEEMLANRARGWLKHRAAVIERCGAKCWYCGRADVFLALDHVLARSRGGADNPENLVPACKPCNSSKGAKLVEDWMAAR
jgi:hypothetical protein